jgi:hypothetical protein
LNQVTGNDYSNYSTSGYAWNSKSNV